MRRTVTIELTQGEAIDLLRQIENMEKQFNWRCRGPMQEMRQKVEREMVQTSQRVEQPAREQSARPDWDTYFMRLARFVSTRSPDPSTQHGCVLVNADRRIVSAGYNGAVQGLPHEIVPLTRPEKYAWMIHAEDNAVLFARQDLRGCTAYVTGHSCAACFRRLLQAGIVRIVYGGVLSACIEERELLACKRMAKARGVQVQAHCEVSAWRPTSSRANCSSLTRVWRTR